MILFHTIRRHTYEKLSPATQADYVRLDSLAPGQKQAWLDALRLDRPGEGRKEFFDQIWSRLGELDESLAVTGEVLVETMRAYGAEGLRYLETQQGAMGFADNNGSAVSPAAAADFFRARLAQPAALATGVTVRFQFTVLRFLPDAEKQLEERYKFVDANRDLWVGLNMAGIEEIDKGNPSRFLAKYRELRSHIPGLALSIHAGEMDGPRCPRARYPPARRHPHRPWRESHPGSRHAPVVAAIPAACWSRST
ncbi:MAG: hypothetical protein WDM96_06155 [Lacunisphaera sp.]